MVTVASRLVEELPRRVRERVEDLGEVKVVFGMIQAGDAANVIPSHCSLAASHPTSVATPMVFDSRHYSLVSYRSSPR